jgi:pullulanase
VFDHVANLVALRKTSAALGENDTEFIHVDTSRSARVMAWRRGSRKEGQAPVVMVANFSDEDTPGDKYVVPNWPDREREDWKDVVDGWKPLAKGTVGTAPLKRWEAKVYTY